MRLRATAMVIRFRALSPPQKLEGSQRTLEPCELVGRGGFEPPTDGLKVEAWRDKGTNSAQLL